MAKTSRSRLVSWAPLSAPVIKLLAQRSGLSEEEITKQLSQILPGVIDKLTPQGRLPTAAELPQTTPVT